MLLIGLTGSLATGKSTVSKILRFSPHNLPIIDADFLARQAVEPGTSGYRKVVSYFGPTTPDLLKPLPKVIRSKVDEFAHTRGRPLNRAALGRRVFGSTPSRVRDRKYLNSIVHPRVRLFILLDTLYYFLAGHWVVILDIPLLYDSGLDVFTPVVLMVAVSDPSIQMQRLRARDPHLTEHEAEDRVKSQGGVEEKVKRTEARGEGRGFVVWNDEGEEELARDVSRLMREIEKGRKGMWRWILLIAWPLALGWVCWEIWKGWIGRKDWERRKRDGKAD
ncbi:MAG: hypothetical protein Q9218_002601 [Villophora microphyllina]